MVSAHAIRNVVGIIGNVISFGLFISPTPTFWRIIKKKDVEQFQYYPYVATVLNCLFWVFYGLPIVKPDSILVATINGVGLVIEFIYLSIYLFYANDNKKRSRVCLLLLAEAIFMAAIILITLLVFHTHKRRTFFVGVFCDAFNIIMYGSPLLVWRKVIKTESVEYMPFWLSLAGFLNGGCWTAYALIQLDVFVLISNGLGFLLGAIQLMLYGYYWMYGKPKPKSVNDEGLKPSDIQLTARDAAVANIV